MSFIRNKFGKKKNSNIIVGHLHRNFIQISVVRRKHRTKLVVRKCSHVFKFIAETTSQLHSCHLKLVNSIKIIRHSNRFRCERASKFDILKYCWFASLEVRNLKNSIISNVIVVSSYQFNHHHFKVVKCAMCISYFTIINVNVLVQLQWKKSTEKLFKFHCDILRLCIFNETNAFTKYTMCSCGETNFLQKFHISSVFLCSCSFFF